MHTRPSLIACILLLCGTAAWAQDPAATHSMADLAGLKKLLEELGYTPEMKKTGDTEYLQFELKHSSGETRNHLVGLDPRASTIYLMGGGFSWAPDPKKASNEWFRKLLKYNHSLAPNYIFLNDFDVIGLTTIIGNVDVSAEKLKTKIKDHLTTFDEKLVPLAKELPGAEKNPTDPK